MARLWGLLTLSARALDPELPRKLLREATVIRNARFTGDAVKAIFYADQAFTEIDALFLGVGSALGHPGGDEVWVVEVERKTAKEQADYYRATQRARRFAEEFGGHFRLRARPVVVYDDLDGRLSYQSFDQGILQHPMSGLRRATAGLGFPTLADLPGLASDKTLLKLALLRQLAATDPNRPDGWRGPLAFARETAAEVGSLHLPARGHQDLGQLPEQRDRWLELGRETDEQLAHRVNGYLAELHQAGALDRHTPAPRLSHEGGTVALRLLTAEAEERR